MGATVDQEGNIIYVESSGVAVPSKGNEGKDRYAIIGTREPDEAQATAAFNLAFAISTIGGCIITTGAAHGIDEKAMQGTRGHNLVVYLPWASYNRGIIPDTARIVVYDPKLHVHWLDSVRNLHPAGCFLSRGALLLHARNYGIVEGTRTVLAFPDSEGGGGTGQGIRVAKHLGIPVLQANRGTITDAPRYIAKVLQQLGFASKDLETTIPGGTGQ